MKSIGFEYADVYIDNKFEKRVFLGDRTIEKKNKIKKTLKLVKIAANRNPGIKYYVHLKYE